ncbi:MAG: response regulator transcription factor [Flavobacteriales bacterium]|jgi:two-component system alkaline phosphatase synthesis response regulator PhoP|nr:response regulator transcription factor [Flavobacteriales bacterium]|tara:strand:+ start:599 stop:1261 length:663 start_codon:yes stop_codon:yes gene_type:complete
MKILIVDDEKDILEFLSYNLEKEGYQVSTALNGVLALGLAKKIKPDLIILDVMMPEMDGVSTCSELRKMPETQNSLILFLTARSEEYSELAGFNAGADDYVTKPIKPKLLISRIKALLKRNKSIESSSSIKIEDIEIDKEKHVLMYRGEEIHLARKEFNLLYYLMTVPGKVFTREEIISEVWNDAYVGDRTIDVHVRKIREKTGSNYIKTIKGVGYKFDI